MRALLLLVVCAALVSCTRSPRSTQRDPVTPAPLPVVSAPPPAPDADLTRCLPVVARACGCVYDCGLGTPNGDGSYSVRHAFWGDTPLRATVAEWCVDGKCATVFDAEIVCDGICAPKPADPSCTCKK